MAWNYGKQSWNIQGYPKVFHLHYSPPCHSRKYPKWNCQVHSNKGTERRKVSCRSMSTDIQRWISDTGCVKMEEQEFLSANQMDRLSQQSSWPKNTAATIMLRSKRFRQRSLPCRQQVVITISWCFWQMLSPYWKLCLTWNHIWWTHYTQSALQKGWFYSRCWSWSADRGNDGKTSKSELALNGIFYYGKPRTVRSGGSWL